MSSQKILNKRSSALSNGEAKLPTPSQLEYGEIAINFANGHETLSIKNNSNEIATFSSDEYNSANYATKTEVGTASGNAVTSARNYTNAISGQLATYIDTNVVGVYRYKGSVTNYSDLSSVSDKKHGDVYNVVNANGNIPAGTNYAWNSGTTSWDSLGGSIDLSAYALTADLTAHTGNSEIHLTTGDVKSQIEAYNYITGYTETDPTVPNWAKQSTKPSYTASEVGAMATSERSNYLPTGTTLDDVADGTTRKLSNYATQANFTAHTASTTVHVTSTEKSTWNGKQDAISDLSTIRNNAQSGSSAYTAITAHTGNTSIHLPSITSSDEGKILQIVNGQWTLVTPTVIYTGNVAPDNILGNNGDIYLQTS